MSVLNGVLSGGMSAQALYDSAQDNAYLDAKEAGLSQEDCEQFAHWWALATISEEASKVLMNGRGNRSKAFERSFNSVMKSVGYDLRNSRFKAISKS